MLPFFFFRLRMNWGLVANRLSQRPSLPYEHAQHIGVLIDAHAPWPSYLLEQLKKDNKVVYRLRYQPKQPFQQKLTPYEKRESFGKKDLNLFGTFNNRATESFFSRDYDMLINTSWKPNLVLDYLSLRSKAGLKVGFCSSALFHKDLFQRKNPYQLFIHGKNQLEAHAYIFKYLALVTHPKAKAYPKPTSARPKKETGSQRSIF